MCGKTGSGKTVFVAWLIKNYLCKATQIFVFDHKYDYSNYFTRQEALFTSSVETCKHSKARIIIVQTAPTLFNVARLCEIALAKGNCITVIEEADLYFKRKNLVTKDESRYVQHAYNLFNYGRRLNAGCILTTRRIQNVNSDLTSQAEHIIVFHLHNPSDLEYLARWVGNKIYALASEDTIEGRELLKKYKYPPLQPFQYVHYQDRKGTNFFDKVKIA